MCEAATLVQRGRVDKPFIHPLLSIIHISHSPNVNLFRSRQTPYQCFSRRYYCNSLVRICAPHESRFILILMPTIRQNPGLPKHSHLLNLLFDLVRYLVPGQFSVIGLFLLCCHRSNRALERVSQPP